MKQSLDRSQSLSSKDANSISQNQKRKIPTAEELLRHYESQGLESREASIKVIDDLQKALFRVMTQSPRGNLRKDDKLMAETSRKLDVINARLLNIDMKLDSKPGYGGALAVGVASGASLRAFGCLFPHVVGAVGRLWNSVRSATTAATPDH
ncbi:hypothetical protein U1Q18_006221 [Sarracenia purpurea var. burkii]